MAAEGQVGVKEELELCKKNQSHMDNLSSLIAAWELNLCQENFNLRVAWYIK